MWWGLGLGLLAAGLLSGPAGPWVAVPAGVLAGLLAWWLDVQLHPMTVCWWCRGRSRVRDQTGRNWRPCMVCGGSGSRRRAFARRKR